MVDNLLRTVTPCQTTFGGLLIAYYILANTVTKAEQTNIKVNCTNDLANNFVTKRLLRVHTFFIIIKMVSERCGKIELESGTCAYGAMYILRKERENAIYLWEENTKQRDPPVLIEHNFYILPTVSIISGSNYIHP